MKYAVDRFFCREENLVTFLRDKLEAGWRFLFAAPSFDFRPTGETLNHEGQDLPTYEKAYGFTTYWYREE